MTIICIKDRKLAWDSQVTSTGGFKWGSINDKVVRLTSNKRSYYVGGCGSLQAIQLFIKRLKEMEADALEEWMIDPKHQTDRTTTLFMYDPKDEIIFEFQDKGAPVWLNMKKKSYAIGTGSEYAYGVMDKGGKAYEAVKMVIGRFDGCGLPIHRAEWRER